MNAKQIDQFCMGYFQAICLILFAVLTIAIPYLLTAGRFCPPVMVGGGFALFTWGLLHIQFRHELTKLIDATNTQETRRDA